MSALPAFPSRLRTRPRPLGAVLLGALLAGAALAACSDDGDGAPAGPEPPFPVEYRAQFVEVRSCRSSTEHDFNRVRVLADSNAAGPYLGRDADFPVGAVVLKEEFDFADTDCTGEVIGWTLMERLPRGSSPETLDWRWQDVAPSRTVLTEDEPRCIGCHTTCGVPPDGYEGTCTVAGANGGAFP